MAAPADLALETLFAPRLPPRWDPLIARVRAMYQLRKSMGEKPSAEERERARAIREEALLEAKRLREPTSAAMRAKASEYHSWFAESALMWLWFSEASGKLLLDTYGSTTQSKFPVDFDGTEEERELVRRAIRELAGTGDLAGDQRERLQQHLRSNLGLKQATTRIITEDLCEQRLSKMQLMSSLYGELPWQDSDLDLVITQTTIFFTLHHEAIELGGPERDGLRDFARKAQEMQSDFNNVRFPAFGHFDGGAINDDFIAALAKRVAASAEMSTEAAPSEAVIRSTLGTMLLLVKSSEAEMFLIHDSWGHGWQETLCEFEWIFHTFAEIAAPPPAQDIMACLSLEGGQVIVREDDFRSYFETDMHRRVEIGINLVVAEIFADLMEHKYGRAHEPLPSSSLLHTATLKLDLSLIDSARMMKLWRGAYAGLRHADSEEREQLAETLAKSLGADASEALSRIQGLLEADYPGLFATPLTREMGTSERATSERATVLDFVTRLGVSVASLDEALTSFIARGEQRYRDMLARDPETPRWHCPAACIDLLALSLAWFYEQDQLVNVWHLDELLNESLWDAMLAFEQAIARQRVA